MQQSSTARNLFSALTFGFALSGFLIAGLTPHRGARPSPQIAQDEGAFHRLADGRPARDCAAILSKNMATFYMQAWSVLLGEHVSPRIIKNFQQGETPDEMLHLLKASNLPAAILHKLPPVPSGIYSLDRCSA